MSESLGGSWEGSGWDLRRWRERPSWFLVSLEQMGQGVPSGCLELDLGPAFLQGFNLPATRMSYNSVK